MLPSSSTLRLPGLRILISCMSYMISKCVFIEGSRSELTYGKVLSPLVGSVGR